MRLTCNQVITTKRFNNLNEASIDIFIPEMMDAFVVQLNGWVWANRKDRKEIITGSIQIPDGWFNHFKLYLYTKGYKFLYKYIKWKIELVSTEVDVQVFYPTVKILNNDPYLVITEVESNKSYLYEKE